MGLYSDKEVRGMRSHAEGDECHPGTPANLELKEHVLQQFDKRYRLARFKALLAQGLDAGEVNRICYQYDHDMLSDHDMKTWGFWIMSFYGGWFEARQEAKGNNGHEHFSEKTTHS